jgi:PAS domain-containing protein
MVDAGDKLDGSDPELGAAVDHLRGVAHRRAVFDAVPLGLASTDLRGNMHEANAELGALLAVHPQFLRGKPLIHFVARSDCRAFRDLLDKVARGADPSPVVLSLRPRHGGRPFPAELRPRNARIGATRVLVWSVLPWIDPLPDDAARPLEALVRAAADAIRPVARARKLALDVDVTTEAHVDAARVACVIAALGDVARVAVRIAEPGGALRVTAHDGGDGATLVAFGEASMRIAAKP